MSKNDNQAHFGTTKSTIGAPAPKPPSPPKPMPKPSK